MKKIVKEIDNEKWKKSIKTYRKNSLKADKKYTKVIFLNKFTALEPIVDDDVTENSVSMSNLVNVSKDLE